MEHDCNPLSFPAQENSSISGQKRQMMAWNNDHASPNFSASTKPKCKHTSGKTRTRWSNQRHQFNPKETERYNIWDTNLTDLNKIDIIQPAPKRLCTRTLKGCSYCKFNTLHPSTSPSDWSSEDWDDKKAKAKEQRSLIDFKLLEQQLQNALQDTTQDTTKDTTQDAVADIQEMDLINGMQDLMLKQDQNLTNMTDIPAPPPVMPVMKYKEPKEDDPTMMYNMTDPEVRLQHEEEKYRI